MESILSLGTQQPDRWVRGHLNNEIGSNTFISQYIHWRWGRAGAGRYHLEIPAANWVGYGYLDRIGSNYFGLCSPSLSPIFNDTLVRQGKIMVRNDCLPPAFS